MDAVGVTSLLSGFVALFFLIVLKPLAAHVDLVDRPDYRKTHSGDVPLVGGLSAFVGLCVAWLLAMPLSDGYGLFLVCATMLVLMGAVDDACDLPASFRLGIQIALGATLAYGSGIYLESFGNLLGFGVIELGPLGPLVTIAAIIGAINAFNMVDGIDGLAGSLSLVALLSLSFLFSVSGRFPLELVFAVALACGLVPYLMANLRIFPFRRKIFMGDAGSMFVGFSVVWLLVQGTDLERSAFRPVTALWLVAIPLMDMVAIMVRRYRKGQSMMKPDRDHLHHIFLRAGFSDREALLVITSIALMFAAIGLLGEYFNVHEYVMFALFLGVFFLYNWALGHAWRLVVMVRRFLSARHE